MHHTLFEERASIFIGLNAIFQFIGDVILEGMGLIPPRINHLALTFLNAFISFKTLSAIQKDKFRFLHEDCQVFWLLELLLIVGDVYYSFHDEWGREFILLRLTFVVCSMFNWIFVTWIIVKYKLYHITYQGGHDVENESFIHDDNASDKENSENNKDALEILNMNKQISIPDNRDGDDTNITAKERTGLKKDVSPPLDPIRENMKDYHQDNECTESVEDSLSDKRSRYRQNRHDSHQQEHPSKLASIGHSAVSNGYHHTPVPHDDHHDHDHHHLDHSHISHDIHHLDHSHVSHDRHDVHPNTLQLKPNHSFTLTQSEVP